MYNLCRLYIEFMYNLCYQVSKNFRYRNNQALTKNYLYNELDYEKYVMGHTSWYTLE